ncbi:Maf family protein [Temperatibacter marinus]|uniref:Nucleoside triphosphate pyrophosphatase n=1 Tax=Temperatibacter marinus TaxID=1456591 RepID=A0AA52EJJ3_9PROT|nr:Maf family protein [Temperatibacter marinus]WND03664.1 Maf family protein [Temperatibacter marinus]
MILASGSETRLMLLKNAGLDITAKHPLADEDGIKQALIEEGVTALDLAIALAEVKALSISRIMPDALVIGADQLLDLKGDYISKATTRAEAEKTLSKLSGQKHQLISGAVVAEGGRVIWRGYDKAQLEVRRLSKDFINTYCDTLGDRLYTSVGCYHLEGLGAQLFHKVTGDYFTILGLPLLPLLKFLQDRGTLLK